MRPKLSPSSAIASSTFAVCPPFINRLVSMSDDNGLAASFFACACATPLHSVGGTTRFTSPTSNAASAMKGSPSSSASAARWYPSICGTSRLDAASGHRPRLTKGMENAALSPA